MACAHISHIQYLTFLEVLGAALGQEFPLWPHTVRQPSAASGAKWFSTNAVQKRASDTQ